MLISTIWYIYLVKRRVSFSDMNLTSHWWIWRVLIFWGVTQCNIAEVYRPFTRMNCLHFQGRKIYWKTSSLLFVVHSSEMSVNFYQSTRCHIQDDSTQQILFYHHYFPAKLCLSAHINCPVVCYQLNSSVPRLMFVVIYNNKVTSQAYLFILKIRKLG